MTGAAQMVRKVKVKSRINNLLGEIRLVIAHLCLASG